MTTKTYDYGTNDLRLSDATAALRCQHFVWWIKDFLIRGTHTVPWTVLGSSDAATASVSDGTDRWTTTFDSSKVVYAGAGSAHSWMLLQAGAAINGKTWNFLINYNSGGWPSEAYCTFKMSTTAYTGGTTTNAPTTTGLEFGVDSLGLPLYSPTLGVCHGVIAQSDGTFALQFSADASARFSFLLLFMTMDNLHTGDIDPEIFYGEGSYSANALSITALKGNPTVLDGFTTCQILPSGSSGIQYDVGSIDPDLVSYTNSSGAPLRSNMAIDAASSQYIEWPTWIYYTTSSIGGASIKGKMVDATIPIGSLAQGSTHDVSGSITSMVCGPFWLPADEVPTL